MSRNFQKVTSFGATISSSYFHTKVCFSLNRSMYMLDTAGRVVFSCVKKKHKDIQVS